MRALLARLLCLVAAITLVDGHIIVLQSYAWASMLNDRIPEQGVSEAISSTFDGEHPCEHCLAATQLKNKSQEEKSKTPEIQLSGLKLVSPRNAPINIPIPPSSTRAAHFTTHITPFQEIHARVPSPPPRPLV